VKGRKTDKVRIAHERSIGFSTGALAGGDFQSALAWMGPTMADAVEVSALRFEELEPLVRDLDRLPVKRYHYVSFHVPSFFHREQEETIVGLLRPVFDRGCNIVVHPDVTF
jgi:hypothetical protein